MKQYNNTFLELLNDYAPKTTPISNQETQKTYDLVVVKGELKPNHFRRGYKALLIAALIGASLLIAAAAYYSVSDAFRGVLKEQNSAGQTAPLSSMSPVVEKSGKMVEETARDQGLAVTVRGVIGDANGFKILVDIVDPNGKPLAIEQADGTLSRDIIRFGSIKMRTEETRDDPGYMPGQFRQYDYYFGDEMIRGMSGSDESIYIDSTGSKVTMLISVGVEATEPLVGKTLCLTLRDLKQFGFWRGTEVGMGADDLYNLVIQFDPLSDVDFQKAGYSLNLETGETVFDYELITDSNQKIPLAPDLPGYFVTNAAVRDNVVYLRGTAPCPNDRERLFEQPQLWNPQTSEYMSFARGGESSDDSGDVTWTLSFGGAASLESLRGYVFVLEAGEGLHPMREGVWEFTIPLDFENTTRIFYPNQEFTIGGFPMLAKELTVSPYYMSMKTVVDAATYEKMMYREHPVKVEWHPIVTGSTAWDEVIESATITMKDGNQITAQMGGGGGYAEDFSIGFDLQVVIDPKQIDSFTFGDLTFSIP